MARSGSRSVQEDKVQTPTTDMPESSLGKRGADSSNTIIQHPYSDASSSYWPPGWNFERFSRATDADRETLSEEELLKMQAGLRDVLGEDGVGKMSLYLWELEKKRNAEAEGRDPTKLTREPGLPPPNWLHHYKKYHKGQPWGFAVFRTACYDDESRWDKFKEEVTRIIQLPFDYEKQYDPVSDGFDEAQERFELRWIEEPELANANLEELLAKYEELRESLSAKLGGKIFLCASEDAVSSVLSIEETEQPTTISNTKHWQSTAPFLLAVVADRPGLEEDHDEWTFFKPVFKAGIATLVDELWWLVDSDIMDIQRITRMVKASEELGPTGAVPDEDLEEIWWSTSPSPQRLRKRRRLDSKTAVASTNV